MGFSQFNAGFTTQHGLSKSSGYELLQMCCLETFLTNTFPQEKALLHEKATDKKRVKLTEKDDENQDPGIRETLQTHHLSSSPDIPFSSFPS